MEVLYILIPLSVVLAVAFTVACVRAIRQGQFDDLESPKWRILFEGNTRPLEDSRKAPVADGNEKVGVKTPNADTRRSESA